MKKSAMAIPAMLALLAVSPVAATAAVDPSLSDLVLGKQLTGEKWTLDTLKGRTVLAYFWNIG